MASIPLELPLKPSEAAALADLIFQQTDGRPLTDEIRNRLAPRLAPLELESMTPYLGSLQKDPVHSSAYFIAVDGLRAPQRQPLLLHLSLASAPASALFPQSMLIGRMRPRGEREVVVNAIPFGPGDAINIWKFAQQVDRSFLPRPQGTRTALVVDIGNDPESAAAAFDAFRNMFRSGWGNMAAIRGDLHVALWAAIRAGWRDGFTIEAPVLDASAGLAAAKEAALATQEYTRFVARCAPNELSFAEDVYDFLQSAKAGLNSWKHFDFELSLTGNEPTDAAAITAIGETLKAGGRAAQAIAPRLTDSEDIEEIAAQLTPLAAAARQVNVTLSFDFTEKGVDAGLLQAIGRACMGRHHVKLPAWKPKFLPALPDADLSEMPPRKQIARYLTWAVENLRS